MDLAVRTSADGGEFATMPFREGGSVPQGPQRPRVLIADDNPEMQRAIVRLLSPSCDLVGCAIDTATLFEVTSRLRPDVVLLDLSLRGEANALEACRRIKETMPEVKFVAFTASDDPDLRRAAHAAGVSEFLWKLRADELPQTIQIVTDRSAGSADNGS
jgi:two-component system, NarL family, response regulator NreC